MKQIIFSVLFITGLTLTATAQSIRFNPYAGYVFDDKVDSYYDANNYYSGKIKGGFSWGGGLEFMASSTKGIELKYLRQDLTAPMDYYKDGVKSKDFELGINYILIGGSNYFKTSGGKVEPYFGAGLGMAIISIKNPDPGVESGKTKFAWNLKGGTNIWASKKVGIKLQAELLSAVQAVGGGFYFGTGGSGAGVSSYSSMLQFALGGALTFKLGE
ncbi:MAG TPA: hypothetical protein VFV68_11440 [Agriterribacter sp.]|nr:hypothetical protein [Agriterribacter sp.]